MARLPVVVLVPPERVTLAPGGTHDLPVRIQNASDRIQHLRVVLLGLDGTGPVPARPPVVKLDTGQTQEVIVTVAVPGSGGPTAGSHVLAVRARSDERPEVSAAEELVLEVSPAPKLALAAEPRLVHGGGSAVLRLQARNEGNTVLECRPSGKDAEGKVRYTFEPARFTLPPGRTKVFGAEVHCRAPFSGAPVTRALDLTVRASGVEAGAAAQFVQKPTLLPAVPKLAGRTVALGVGAAALLAAALLLRPDAPESEPVSTSTSTESPGDPTTGDPTTGDPTTGNGPPTDGSPTTTNGTTPGETTAGTGGTRAPLAVDFTMSPDSTPFGNRFVAADAWPGLSVTAVTSDSTYATCREPQVPAVVLRTGDGVGRYLGTAVEADERACADLGLQFRFTDPVASVRIAFLPRTGRTRTAVSPETYELRVELASGATEQVPAVAGEPTAEQGVDLPDATGQAVYSTSGGDLITNVTLQTVGDVSGFAIVKSLNTGT